MLNRSRTHDVKNMTFLILWLLNFFNQFKMNSLVKVSCLGKRKSLELYDDIRIHSHLDHLIKLIQLTKDRHHMNTIFGINYILFDLINHCLWATVSQKNQEQKFVRIYLIHGEFCLQ